MVDITGQNTNITRAATIATAAVVILMILLVTPVAAQDVIDEPIVIDPIDPNVDCDGDACFEVKNLQVWAVDPVTGEKVDNPSAGDTIKYSAEIHNTGSKRGEKYVKYRERKVDPDVAGFGGGGVLFKLDSGEKKTFTQTQETTHDGGQTGPIGDGGTWKVQVYTGDGTTLLGDDTMDDLDNETITLCCEPEASIDNYTPTNPNLRETVTFTGSGDDPDYRSGKGSRGPDLSYQWDTPTCSPCAFGKTANLSFRNYGEQTVKLTVTDDDSQKKTVSTTVRVNRPPKARFAFSPKELGVGETVTFDASDSSDSDPYDTELSYRWDFDGDGSFEQTGEVVTNTFSTVGDKYVRLEVQDSRGATSIAGRRITVKNNPPTASFDYTPKPPGVGETAEFTADASDPDGTVESYEWDFDGDGTIDATGETENHAFATKGRKDVTLTVTDDNGGTTTTSRTVPVTEPPTASIGHSPSPLITGESAEFNASASDPDGTVESYEWDFDGDGTTDATGETVNHAFGTNGEKIVKLTVTDDTGASTTVSKTVTVTERPTVGIDYSPSPPVVRSLESLKPSTTFTPSSDTSDPDGTIESYWWVIDGEVVGPSSALGYKFQKPGEYDVELVVEDNDGASASASVTVTATYAPDVSIESSPTPLITGEAGKFTANATDRDGTVESYEWDFDGDDSTDATGKKVNKKFGTSGEKKIAVTITDDTGASTTVTKTVTVSSIEYTPSQPNVGESVSMSLSSSAYDLDSIESYEWQIDGEAAASGPSPSLGLYNGFETRGDHEVSLNITYDNGKSVTESVTIPVNSPPEAAFDVTGDASGPGFTVSLDASASSDIEGDTLKYEIDWGDGSTDTGVRAEHTYGTASEKTISLTVTDEHGLSDTAKKTVGAGGKRSTGRGNSGNVGDNKRNRGRNGRGYERSRRNRGR